MPPSCCKMKENGIVYKDQILTDREYKFFTECMFFKNPISSNFFYGCFKIINDKVEITYVIVILLLAAVCILLQVILFSSKYI